MPLEVCKDAWIPSEVGKEACMPLEVCKDAWMPSEVGKDAWKPFEADMGAVVGLGLRDNWCNRCCTGVLGVRWGEAGLGTGSIGLLAGVNRRDNDAVAGLLPSVKLPARLVYSFRRVKSFRRGNVLSK